MNAKRSFSLVKTLALLVGALCLSTTLASAQEVPLKGQFTLPFEITWGGTVLPAGDYSFKLNSISPPNTIQIRGEGKNVMVMAQGVNDYPSSNESSLTLVRHGSSREVRTLQLAPLGITLYYAPPKGSAPFVAQAPELIQRVRVSVSGK